jgi:hypothetical protein
VSIAKEETREFLKQLKTEISSAFPEIIQDATKEAILDYLKKRRVLAKMQYRKIVKPSIKGDKNHG